MLKRVQKKGFTIVELLTVMSIIIILMSVMVPALSRVRRFAKVVTQKGQFSDISKGLEIYRSEHSDTYPDSGPTAPDSTGAINGYCGAMKLCEALVGQDGLGFHPSSQFTANGTVIISGDPCDLYPFDLCASIDPVDYTDLLAANLRERVKYVDSENIKAVRLIDIYTWDIGSSAQSFYDNQTFNTNPGNPYGFPNAVIGDVFLRTDIKAGHCTERAGQKVGMPVLYYKADPARLVHDFNTAPESGTPNQNIYNFDDNYAITMLGCPWESVMTTEHPVYSDPRVFYKQITNPKVTATPRPHNEDSYILMSAGFDGLYGTKDDVFNFTD